MAATGMLASCGGRVHRALSDPTRSASPSTTAAPTLAPKASSPPPTPRRPSEPQPSELQPSEPVATLVATLRGAAPASVTPGGKPVSNVPGSWYGYPSILPVIERVPGWIEVREAQRPNESTAWMPAADATVSTDPYYLVLNLATTHLQLFLRGHPLLDVPAGVGTPDAPTVTGEFFIAMKAPPPDPGYGPFVLVTSAHSDTYTDWEGEGDGIIAIHGPIDASADQLIGTTGARISHGCIRLHDADLAELADVPPGTPLDIVN